MIGSTLLHAAPGGTAVPEHGALSHDARTGNYRRSLISRWRRWR